MASTGLGLNREAVDPDSNTPLATSKPLFETFRLRMP